MAAFVEMLGETLLSGQEDVSTVEALASKKAVALYFSAHWCPPCRGFTPKLAEWYRANLEAKGLEIIFVSSDRDEDAFKDYFGEQPWKALPFNDRLRKEALSKKFKVSGIPSLVILDSEGKTITKDGRTAISSDPTGEEFPWKPKSLKDILSAVKLVSKDGPVDKSTLEGKVLGFYFSAHWCPPCRGFTPQLAKWYSEGLKDKDFEIIFVSSDRDETAFKEYHAEQPWPALAFENRKAKEELNNLYGVQGIPSLVIVDKDGSTVTTDGRSAVSRDSKGSNFPWHPKPVADLEDGPGNLNEAPAVVVLCEAAGAAAQQAAEDAMTQMAKMYLDEAKVKGEECPEMSFMIAKTSAGIPRQLRNMMALEAVPPSCHEHELKEQDNHGSWGCDGCGKGGPAAVKRFRCTQGCDFDFCEDCNGLAGSGATIPPKLVLIDISSDGSFYEGPEGDITEETVEKFVKDFKAGNLKQKQLKM